MNREERLSKLAREVFDVVIIGGGINGAVSAAALAGHGVKVALIDRGDYASCTSQESSFLAWGGIKYMENYEFSLVRDLCISRNHLMKHYPSTVKEIRFFSPHEKTFRHSLLKLLSGVWFYWSIGNFFTKKPRKLCINDIKREEPIVNTSLIDGGFEYSDSYLEDCDARFVYGFIKKAQLNGACAINYVESLGAEKLADGMWKINVKDNAQENGASFTIRSKAVINACGPYADFVNQANKIKTRTRHVFSKGIHLIVPRLTPSNRILTFVASDSRMFFVIPLGSASCIGTTDTRVEGPKVCVTDEDRRFVLENINAKLNRTKPLTLDDIIAERCGVRPLAIEGSETEGSAKDFLALSRKHVVEKSSEHKYVSIFGGKITDCLNVGEEICEAIRSFGIAVKTPEALWYGEPNSAEYTRFMERAGKMGLDEMKSPDAWELPSTRLWRRYQLDAHHILDELEKNDSAREIYKLGIEYFAAEISYMAAHEDIISLEDFLRRRTILSLVNKKEMLVTSDAVQRICALLFGSQASKKLNDFKNIAA